MPKDLFSYLNVRKTVETWKYKPITDNNCVKGNVPLDFLKLDNKILPISQNLVVLLKYLGIKIFIENDCLIVISDESKKRILNSFSSFITIVIQEAELLGFKISRSKFKNSLLLILENGGVL